MKKEKEFNYKSIALQSLVDYVNNYPEYTLSESLCSFLREKISGVKETKDIKKLSDETIYTLIDEANEFEKAELDK